MEKKIDLAKFMLLNTEKSVSEIAKEITLLDSSGNPSTSGKIVLLSIGFSNATQEWSTFFTENKNSTST